jgi:uncharacterized protein with beta-barrel porin domain
VGADRDLDATTRLGVFAGGGFGTVDAEYGSQELDMAHGFAGVYSSHEFGRSFVDLSVLAGYADFSSIRDVTNNTVAGGIERASADYDALFLAPEIQVGGFVDAGMTLLPRASLRYAGLYTDSYTETGSAQNLEVDENALHVLSARAELGVPLTVEDGRAAITQILPRAGVEARAAFGDELDLVLLGQDMSVEPGGKDSAVGGFFGVQVLHESGSRRSALFADVEAAYGTDQAFGAKGRVGYQFRF